MIDGKPKCMKTTGGKLVLDVSQGTEDEKRKVVERYIPRSVGLITFLKGGKPVDSVYTTDAKSMINERYCGYSTHKWDYTDRIIVDLREHIGLESIVPMNHIHNPY